MKGKKYSFFVRETSLANDIALDRKKVFFLATAAPVIRKSKTSLQHFIQNSKVFFSPPRNKKCKKTHVVKKHRGPSN